MVMLNKEWRKPETQAFLINKILTPLTKVLHRLSGPKRLWDFIVIGFVLALILWRLLRLPKPEKQYTVWHNVKVLIDIRDLIDKYYTLPARRKGVIFLMDKVITKVCSDTHYMSLLDFVIEQIFRRGWERRPYQHPSPDYWAEPEPYGGYYPFADDLTDNGKLTNDLRNYVKGE